MGKTTIDFKKVGERHGVTAVEAKEVWMSVFRFIKHKIASYDFLMMDDGELEKINVDFVIPGLGQLRLNRKHIRSRQAIYKDYIEREKNKNTQQHEGYKSEENQAGVHDGAADLRQV